MPSNVLETVTECASPGMVGKKHFSRSSETASVTQTMDIIGSIYMPKMMETTFETDSQTRTELTTTAGAETSYLSDTSLVTSDAVTTDCTSQDESEIEVDEAAQRTSGIIH